MIIPRKYQHRLRRLSAYHKTGHEIYEVLLGDVTRGSETQPLGDLVDGHYVRYT